MSFGFLSGLVACKKIIFLTLKFKFSRTFFIADSDEESSWDSDIGLLIVFTPSFLENFKIFSSSDET